MFGGINCLSRLASALLPSLRCCGRVDSISFDSLNFDSHLVDFAVFNSCLFGFVFEFDIWAFFRFGFGGDFIFFGCLSKCYFGSVGQSFYDVSIDFEGELFPHYFLLVSRENGVFIEDYLTTPDQFPILWIPSL